MTKAGVNKLFSNRAALTIQGLAEGQYLKSCDSFLECDVIVEFTRINFICNVLSFKSAVFRLQV